LPITVRDARMLIFLPHSSFEHPASAISQKSDVYSSSPPATKKDIFRSQTTCTSAIWSVENSCYRH